MRPIYWVLIILLILLVAAGVYLLTRRPGAGRDHREVSDYAPGGKHVAAGDSGTQPTGSRSQTGSAPSDRATDPASAPTPAPEPAYTDTATGDEVALEDEARPGEAQDGMRSSSDEVEPAEPVQTPRSEHRAGSSAVTFGSAPEIGEDRVHAVPVDADPESERESPSDTVREPEPEPEPERAPEPRSEPRRGWEEPDDDVPADAAAAGFEPTPSPYGPGTALPAEDGSGPAGWEIKGNAGSMLFHTPDSPSYADARAEVWFESEQSARAAGFAHWDRRRR